MYQALCQLLLYKIKLGCWYWPLTGEQTSQNPTPSFCIYTGGDKNITSPSLIHYCTDKFSIMWGVQGPIQLIIVQAILKARWLGAQFVFKVLSSHIDQNPSLIQGCLLSPPFMDKRPESLSLGLAHMACDFIWCFKDPIFIYHLSPYLIA